MSKTLKNIIINNKNKSTDISDSINSNSDDSDFNINNINVQELIYPCKDEILSTKILLHPHQINNDIYINLKKNLIDKIEGKCYKDGYVIKVYKIIEYKNGIIEPEYFTGTVIFDIKYLANICIVIRESIIIAKISSFLPATNFALAEFGDKPIIKIIFTKSVKDINIKNFTIKNNKDIIHNTSKKLLAVGDYIKIQIKTIRFYQNDNIINCIGYLIDLATDDEINKYAYHEENNIIKNEKHNSDILINEEI